MEKLFGLTGIRGVAGKYPLDPTSCVKLGFALAKEVLENKKEGEEIKFLIGCDTRISSSMIKSAVISGILYAGVDVIDVDVIPTPSIVYLQDTMKAKIGIMITASHNPYQDNGIKVFMPNGLRMQEEFKRKIEEEMQDENFKIQSDKQIGKLFKLDDASGRCVEFLKSFFPKNLNLSNLRIGLDFANGAGFIVGEKLFQELGASVETRGNRPNGRNINAGFGSIYPEVLSKLVIDNHLNIGIALDGDGDRLVLVDEDGDVLDGDEILAILATYYKQQGKLKNDAIVATIMSNMGLDVCLKAQGITVRRSRVGEVHVLDEILKYDLQIGGEQSGHIILREVGNAGDGLATALKILEIIVSEGKSLKELRSVYKRFPQKLKSFNVISKPALETIEGYPELKEQIENEFKDSGRILIRYSETENKIRVMVEHLDEKICDEKLNQLVNFFQEKIGA